MATLIKPSFAGGEIAPALYGRVDLSKFQVALRTCRNFFVQAWGGVANRPGFEHIGELLSGDGIYRAIPFQFNTEQTYELIFGDQIMYVIMDGGFVLENPKAIISATNASPVVIGATAHGDTNGQLVYIADVVGEDDLNGRIFKAAGVAANSLQLTDFLGAAIDGTGYGAYVSGGTISRVYSIATPYAEEDLALLKFVQSADVMTLVHPGYDPRELSRTGHAAWTLSTITYAPGIVAPVGLAVTPKTAGGEFYAYAVTRFADTGSEESLADTAFTNTAAVLSATNYIDLAWTDPGGVTYTIYRRQDGGSVYGFIGTSTNGTFRDINFAPDFSDTPPSSRDPFSGAGNNPGCVTYHAERQIYGRTDNQRQTIFGSKVGAYKNFGVAQPAKDDDAITYTLVSREAQEIRHLVSLDDLLIFTVGAVWVMKPGGQSDQITPSSVVAKPQIYDGSSDVPPIVAGTVALFVEEGGQHVHDIGYKFEIDGYAGDDLTVLAPHLFEGRSIKEWCYAKRPYSIVWAITDDGALLGFTYLRQHDVWAWHRHDTQGYFQSISCIREGQEDAVYAIVRRYIDGRWRQFVERLHSRIFDDVRDCFFVDCGASLDAPFTITSITAANPPVVTTDTASGLLDGEIIDLDEAQIVSDGLLADHPASGGRYSVGILTSTTFQLRDEQTGAAIDGTAWAAHEAGTGVIRKAVTTVKGLWHLEGSTVAILADGGDVEPQEVTSGRITLDNPASRVHVGLPYLSDFETLDLDVAGMNVNTLQGKRKTVPYATIRFEKTRGGAIGPDFDTLKEFKQLQAQLDQPAALVTGDVQHRLIPAWDTGGRIAIRQSAPLPMTINSVIPEVIGGGH